MGITDYTDTLPSHSELNRSVSMETEEESAYSRPGSQHEGTWALWITLIPYD